MSRILVIGRKLMNFKFDKAKIRFVQTDKSTEAVIKSVRSLYKTKEREVNGYALFLLLMPVSAFALGTWQVKRKKWKEDLIADLATRTTLPPVDFPEDLEELKNMEFHPVRLVGKFDHSRELYLGPRSLITKGESASSGGSIISSGQTGFHVITPFQLENRDLTILVNRGWVPQKQKNPHTRPEGQVTDTVEIMGVVRHTEARQPLTPQNQPQTGLWLYRDLDLMSQISGAEPICVDALESSTVPGGPVGGQTRISLRNEHLSYILTWYGLSAATAFMWYKHFIAKAKMV